MILFEKSNHLLKVFCSTNYVIIGDPVFVSDSSFSLNEYWNDAKQNNNVGDSSRDEGYLELQWDLPKDMSLAEKFVLRFDEFSSKHGKNITENVFKVFEMKDMYYIYITSFKSRNSYTT